jgi:hypothetical protein
MTANIKRNSLKEIEKDKDKVNSMKGRFASFLRLITIHGIYIKK